MVNALKKKMLGFAVVTVLAAALMVGCGNKSKNNSATSPSSGNGATDMPNETELPESTNNAADDAGNAVDDEYLYVGAVLQEEDIKIGRAHV